ncbi:MAG: hypothetical protein V9E90_12275 [Saprospiraceae bacterium]|jgi:hypothetical protein
MKNTDNTSAAYPPYKNEAINKLYELLFCDNPQIFNNSNDVNTTYPWNILLFDPLNTADLFNITQDPSLESRTKLLAYYLLRKHGEKIQTKELLGVVIEVALEEGLDVLAAYHDGTARYINYSEKVILLEDSQEQSNELIQILFEKSNQVINQIGPWNQDRLPYPDTGQVRLSFLVSDGLYFGQGPINQLFQDPMGGPVLETASQLMSYLIELNESSTH